MKRLLLIITCCSPLILSPASSFALDSTIVTAAENIVYKKYGPIRYYESLWSVSKKLRPSNLVSIQQTLVAIYKLNPNVFLAGDINLLIEDSVIKVPTESFIKKQSNQDAINLINKYSDKQKVPSNTVVAETAVSETVAAEKNADALRATSGSLSKSQALEVSDQSLTASLIDEKYLPAPNSAVSQSLIKIQTLQTELNMVNEQLAATTKINQEFKSKLQLLIDEIDLLKDKIEGESAAQLSLLELVEQYKSESISAPQPVINHAQVQGQNGSWISGSLSNVLLIAGFGLLFMTFIFSLLFRRKAKYLLDEKPKCINGPDKSFVASPEPSYDEQKPQQPMPADIKSGTPFDKGPDEVEQLQDAAAQAEQNHKKAKEPVEKEQLTEAINLKNAEAYIDIETILKNSEKDSPDDIYTEFDFDLGLDEFPDMLGEHSAIDIDDDEYGISAHLDLARAYLEIDDKISARKILMAAIKNSNVEQRLEINKLLTLL
ncbi:FimV/HubP family polar landmark protein [Psychromonas sp.]|uniref:FimV/HubP family polar landmark protein n=1 Tax=Psychromonas sp. TaxID=1884585 RepID=UPI0039E2E8DB